MTAAGPRRLTVAMYAAKDVTRDSRVLREADALAGAGHHVVLVARPPAGITEPSEDARPSGVRLVRIARDNTDLDRWRSIQQRVGYPWRSRRALGAAVRRDLRSGPPGWGRLAAALLGLVLALPWFAYRLVAYTLFRDRLPGARREGQLDYVVSWRRSVYPWARTVASAVPGADIHHGHDLTGLAAAVAAAGRTGGRVVYDSHELYPESGRHARQGPLARRWLRSVERRLARQAVALVTVNATLEQILRASLGFTRSVVVHNAPPRWTPPEPAPDLLREALHLPPEARIALYHGNLAAHRGLEQFAEAILEPGLESVHAVFLGFGPEQAAMEALAAEARYGGRVHVLEAVPPSELLPWIASADVGVICIQPSTLNHRSSTPNKLFEAFAAGLPVVASDFEEMRRIVLEDPAGPLGAVCDPTSPRSIAAAIRSIVDLSPADTAALRARCLLAAHERWNWETESARLVALYETLAAEVAP